jgi:hypothetical protein
MMSETTGRRREVPIGFRWRVQRAVKREVGALAASYLKTLSDFGFTCYVGYRESGMTHEESLRLARLSADIGDDITEISRSNARVETTVRRRSER